MKGRGSLRARLTRMDSMYCRTDDTSLLCTQPQTHVSCELPIPIRPCAEGSVRTFLPHCLLNFPCRANAYKGVNKA